MRFSIVIPAFNEAEYITKAISSLQHQTVSRNDFEILVVDNNSQDNTAELALKAGADRVIKEIIQGTNFARQRGYEESKGEIVAFLDADCQAPSDWLKKIEKDLLKPGVAAVSGPFDYQFPGIKGILNKIYNLSLPYVPFLLHLIFRKKAGVIIGGNFALWRQSLAKIGRFPPLKFWGDDAAIAMLVSRRVGKVVFDPNLVVKSSPRRFKKQGFFKLTFLYIIAYLKVYFSHKYK